MSYGASKGTRRHLRAQVRWAKARQRMITLLCAMSAVSVPLAAPAPSAATEGCPNASARVGPSEGLPECRAYEMVTPVSKNGDRVSFSFALEGSTPGSVEVGADSIGVLGDATSDPDCPFTDYDLARTDSGWMTSALSDVPLTSLAYGTNKCAKVIMNRLGESLLIIRPASHSIYERDLYRQAPSGGEFQKIGPMLPPEKLPQTPAGPDLQAGEATYVSGALDFSRVLFTLRPLSEAERWPNDSTLIASNDTFFNTSLYEYSGNEHSEPRLVGVDNNGRLISDCGTSPGGSQQKGNRLDAISSDGSRVFFTAVGMGEPATPECAGASVVPPVDELFARLNGATTVALSEPLALSPAEPDSECSTAECRANISEPGSFRDANYEGAAITGEKVFFSSTQQLVNGATQDPVSTDSAVPRNGEKGCPVTTGAGGCNLYEYDFAKSPATGEPVGLTLLSAGSSSGARVQGIAAISGDGSRVFFVAKGVLTRTSNTEGVTAKAGEENLYVTDTDTGLTEFIATLGATKEDRSQWTYNGENPMDVTEDGRYLVFTTSAQVTQDDTSNVAQVFRYDADTGALVRISVGDGGYNDDGNSALAPALIERTATESEEALGGVGRDAHPAVAEDGAVVFKSGDALTPQAYDNKCVVLEGEECFEYAQNIYEYREGHVYLISGGSGRPLELTEGAAAISPNGEDIFFESREALVSGDSDTITDVYDARRDGGFSRVAASSPCQGESCQSASVLTQTPPSPGSALFSGPMTPPLATIGQVVPKAKPTRAQLLAAALKACRKARKVKRRSCESRARHQYGSKPKTQPKKRKR